MTQKLDGTGYFLVEVKAGPGKILVSIDHPSGTRLDDCVSLSRFLHQSLDDTDVFEKHELEVGSPGMEEPLLVLPQFLKRLGQQVNVLTRDGMKHTGILREADAQGIGLDEEIIIHKGKKKEKQITPVHLGFSDIKETRVHFTFD